MNDEETRYQAVRSRDERFDGVFFTAVSTTGIYCRPSCPAVTPKRPNVRFYPTAAAAQGAGFRACRRCRPDAVPGSPEWNTRADLVGRAMRLIGDGVVDREGVAGLADRLGYSARQVHRQLTTELGAGPVALARAQRAHTARVLLQTTELPVTRTAFAAGFSSVRQFNDTVRAVYGYTPTQLRAAADGGPRGSASAGLVPLRLAHRRPYDATGVFDFLSARAVPGVEETTGAPGARVYRRTLRLPNGHGIAEVEEPRGRGAGRPWLECRLHLSDLRDLTTAVQRARALFDLDADPGAVAERLSADPLLGPLAAARPGLRSPGAPDPHEQAVRAVLGQQITVAAARTLAGRLTAALGDPLPEPDGGLTRLFPAPEALAASDLAFLAMPVSRKDALRTLAAALADGTVRLDPGADRDEAERSLRALRGIGPWTTGYIRMRALGDPDVFLPSDAGVRHGLTGLGAPGDPRAAELAARGWRPWRSYALHHLWAAGTPAGEEPVRGTSPAAAHGPRSTAHEPRTNQDEKEEER